MEIYCGDVIELAAKLEPNSIQAVICSPPYAMQRKTTYGGITEEDYPNWTVCWMNSLIEKMSSDASVFIVIREHITCGQISDYVLKTRLAVREAGWFEPETLIWWKPDAPPLGSILRPRRTWEYILWFSRSSNPYVDLRACGNTESTRTGGFAGSSRFGDGGDSPIHSGQKRQKLKKGVSRCTDLIHVNIGTIDRGISHPAMYPQGIPDFLIQTFTIKGDTVLDPFCGSGQTGLSAVKHGRQFVGFDLKVEYVELAKSRLSVCSNPEFFRKC